MRDDVVSAADLIKYFRGNPPEEPERFYRLTREGNWLRRTREAAKFLEVRRKRVVSHAAVRYRVICETVVSAGPGLAN